MQAIAMDRLYTWEQQREDLVNRAQALEEPQRQAMSRSGSLFELLSIPVPEAARALISTALSA